MLLSSLSSGIKSVQRGVTTLNGTNYSETSKNITVSSVNMAKAFLTVSRTGPMEVFLLASLTSATNINIKTTYGFYNPIEVSWELVEFN